MSEKTMTVATEAIFQLQLNTPEAIRYVVKRAGVSPRDAGTAIKEAMVGYKSRG
jgi:hypothetical protein